MGASFGPRLCNSNPESSHTATDHHGPKVWLWHRWDLQRSVKVRVPPCFPITRTRRIEKDPTVACNSLLARAIAKMAAKTDKAWWSHKRWSKCQCQQLQWSLQVFVIRVGVRLGNLNHCAAVKETQSGDKRQTLGSLQSRWQVPFYQSIHRFHGRLIDYDD